jgi:uncharacterized protein YndB with AHSA1/START domain
MARWIRTFQSCVWMNSGAHRAGPVGGGLIRACLRIGPDAHEGERDVSEGLEHRGGGDDQLDDRPGPGVVERSEGGQTHRGQRRPQKAQRAAEGMRVIGPASPEAVYRAHIEPEIIKTWMLGPEGWTMPVCINDARPGGKIRYEWSNGKGGGFHLTGEFVKLEPPHRILHVERMHMPEATPDNHVETIFAKDGSGTLMTMRMTLPDAATREAMLKTSRP